MNIPTRSGSWVRQKGTIMHAFTVKGLVVFTGLALLGGGLAGYAVGHVEDRPSVITLGVLSTTYATPVASPSQIPATEDSPGWDCRVQGNHVCGYQGELWLNVSHLPASLYARCLLGLGATGLSSEVASIDTAEICKPLYVNG